MGLLPIGRNGNNMEKLIFRAYPHLRDILLASLIHTSAPGKLGEYLASGRPILAHVPANSFVAVYCSSHHCADVASQNDATILAREIEHIINDRNFRAGIVRMALTQAQLDFHPRVAREKFVQLMEIKSRPN
jgi:hypothetical protein